MTDFIPMEQLWLKVQERTNNHAATASDFITFLEDNNWFGIEPLIEDIEEQIKVSLSIENLDNFINLSAAFLDRLVLQDKERLVFLYKTLANNYPESAETLQEYVKEKHVAAFHAMQIADFLISFLEKEIYMLNNAELEDLLYRFSDEMSKTTGITFAHYLNWLSNKRLTKFKKITIPNISRNNVSHTKYAYDFDTCIRLFYVLFSQTSIEENDFYELIATNEKSAVALLFLSLHMICALRDEDIKRLPHPKLMESPEKVLESIKNSSLSNTDALIAVEKVLREIEILQPKPNKTAMHNNIPYIKLFIPESAKIHFGYLFAAAEAHYQLKNDERKQYYIYPVTTYDEFQKYLGDDVADIFWETDYSTRAFNKTYMQLIQQYIDADLSGNVTESVHPIGYMFAAFARSHKTTYGEFAATTTTYLKDQSVSGHSVEYIVQELTERGVCSFIVSELLEILYQKDFRRLPMKEQTKLIRNFGLNPYEVENSVITYEIALENATNVVTEILQFPAEQRHHLISRALDNIAAGSAVSKEKHIMCLLTSLGKDCAYPERKQCIGCKYEILTKSSIYTLAAEYQRNRKLMQDAQNPVLKIKYKMLLKNVIIPTIQEILICTSEKEGPEYVRELEKITREVLANDK